MSIETVLTATAELVKTIAVTAGPDDRVWTHPGQTEQIKTNKFPFVVVAKMNAEPGAWRAESFGAGEHKWDMLIAVYLHDGPVVVTNTDDATVSAMANANEWYQALADLLYANMTLSGTVDIIGDGDGKLFDYVTDNLIWEGQQRYGHLFVVPVNQSVIQGVSA